MGRRHHPAALCRYRHAALSARWPSRPFHAAWAHRCHTAKLMAGLEGSLIRERMMAGKEAMRRNGRWAAGRHCLPFGVGYDRQNHRFFYLPEAEKVREVFRQFLTGNQNYDQLSALLNMSRGSGHNVLENPIYSGWLVIDESGIYRLLRNALALMGVAASRRKIKRAPEEIIRVRVIDEPLIAQADFDRLQDLIRQKAEGHIRMRTRRSATLPTTVSLVRQMRGAASYVPESIRPPLLHLQRRKHKTQPGISFARYSSLPESRQARINAGSPLYRKTHGPPFPQTLYDCQWNKPSDRGLNHGWNGCGPRSSAWN